VKILDAGETDGHHWYESEYASDGHFGTMAGYLFYSDLDRVKYFRQICSGVQALHALDPPITHRDLKPRNILAFEYLEPERHMVLKIADFGIAAIAGDASGLTTTGAALGTAHYMAPERERNPRIKTPQSDIYSLGITFLEACTGHTRPSQENLNLVPDLLRPIIEKMVRQRPGDRYQSVAVIIEALNSFSYFRLLHGRELRENESGTVSFSVNIGRELENALNAIFVCDSDSVLDWLADLERTMDRLGDAHDHEAQTIKNIPGTALAMIEKADLEALLRLVQ
jgi:serine/threonine protein kinase